MATLSTSVANLRQPAGPLRLERRGEPRQAVREQAVALVREAHRARICGLQVDNISEHGLGAWVSQPIEPGSPITAMLSGHGAEREKERHGRVVRCRPHNGGFEIGVHFPPRRAA